MSRVHGTIIKTLLSFYPGALAVYLFGTYETPGETEKSDVDIAVLFSPGLSRAAGNLGVSECRSSLEDVLGKKVDLVNIAIANTVLQHEIIREGRLIYCRDEYAVQVFEMQVLSAYQKLNEERAGILEEIFESGRIIEQ